MIVFDLTCPEGHVFETWFRNGAAFDQQAKAGLLVCPTCGSKDIKKSLMAPNLSGSKKTFEAPDPTRPEKAMPQKAVPQKAVMETKQAAEVMKALKALRHTIEENCDYVGEAFAEEARKIHYGESETRGIYGETSEEEAAKLADEGVAVSRVPWAPREDA